MGGITSCPPPVASAQPARVNKQKETCDGQEGRNVRLWQLRVVSEYVKDHIATAPAAATRVTSPAAERRPLCRSRHGTGAGAAATGTRPYLGCAQASGC